MKITFEPDWCSDAIFEFDLQDLEAYLVRQIKDRGHSLSTHKQIALQQQQTIQSFQERLEVVQGANTAQASEPIQWEDITPANWTGDGFCFSVVKSGYGICFCPQCQEVYTALELRVGNHLFQSDTSIQYVFCPKYHRLLQDRYII